MKNFCLDLEEHATKIINYEKKEMIPLTKKGEKKHNKQKVCHICKKIFKTGDGNKKYHKVRDHCHYTGKYRGAAHDICNLIYTIPKEIPVVFRNGSTYDYHFIIKELAAQPTFQHRINVVSTLGSTLKYVDPTLKMKQNPTSDFQRCTTLIQRRCPTSKQR